LIEQVSDAGLRGRGGAGFPTGRKLRAVAAQRGEPIVVANGSEGEPASAKDKVLLARSPHLVLDGAVAAASAVGAAEAIVVCHPWVRDLVAEALAERVTAGLDPVRLAVVGSADRFVAGEATAVVSWLDGGAPIPTGRRWVAERGVRGRPTLVQNVETLAHLALIARYGAAWYRSVGTDAEPGSMLVTLLGAVRRPGVYEVALGTPFLGVLGQADGAVGRCQAVLIGGYFGTWLDFSSAAELDFSAAGLRAAGGSPGGGLVAVLPADACGLVETATLARYLASQSAGQCGPCVFGLADIATELELVASGAQVDRARLARWLSQVEGRGACHHPDGAVRMVRSALVVFATELERHRRHACCAPRRTNVLAVPASVR
jgi:NADH:ubiquinone oxidoreductase subunit F (NADH-binding)